MPRSVPATLLIVALVLILQPAGAMNQTGPADYYMAYDLSFSINVINDGSSTIDLAASTLTSPTMFLFFNNTSQTVRLTSSSHKVVIASDSERNPIGLFQVDRHLGPGQSILIQADFRAFTMLTPMRRFEWTPELEYHSSGLMREIPRELIAQYCVPAGPWKINDAADSWRSVRELALKLAGNETNVLKTVVRMIDWLGQNVRYPTTKRDRILLPDETLAALEGDCDEQSNLIISLCRIVGIPAYLQCGCTYLPSKVEKRTRYDGRVSFELDRLGWHAWAMVYIPPWGWLPVDMTMGYSKEDALRAIQTAAPQALSTLISNNYFTKDYVSEANHDAEQLKRMNVRIEQRDIMKPIEISSEYQASGHAWITTLILICLGVVVLSAYVAARAKRRRELRT